MTVHLLMLGPDRRSMAGRVPRPHRADEGTDQSISPAHGAPHPYRVNPPAATVRGKGPDHDGPVSRRH
jgi:hypothetical protein